MVEAIDDVLTPERLKKCDILLIALFPDATIEWLKNNASGIKKGAIVCDCCGVKKDICDVGYKLAAEYGFDFLGGHPMAGVEKFGFAAAQPNLFNRASMVIVPQIGTSLDTLEKAKKFFLELGFTRITITTADEHDRVIAYTSQLAHILSNAYIKSETAFAHKGVSAGSFRDMTRVATLQPSMWAELFLRNKEPLMDELDGLIRRLSEYRDAIDGNDSKKLFELLDEGSRRKAEIDKIK
jgi:prephenate dehydrogenase